METEIVRPYASKDPGKATQPPPTRSSRLVKIKKVDRPTKKRLFVIASSDEEDAPSPPHKKPKEAIPSSSSSSDNDPDMEQTLLEAKKLSKGKNIAASKSLSILFVHMLLCSFVQPICR